MRPTRTIYRLERTSDADALAELTRTSAYPRRYPTIVAERDGRVIGCMASYEADGYLMAGPLAVDLPAGHSRGIVAYRLVQAYESLLRSAGLDHYHTAITNPQWRDATTRRWASDFCGEIADGQFLYRRDLTDGQNTAEA